MNFAHEVKHIKAKFFKVECPLRFVDGIITDLECTMDTGDRFIIPPSLFVKDKHFILIDISFCEKNLKKSKEFIKKFHHFKNIMFQ